MKHKAKIAITIAIVGALGGIGNVMYDMALSSKGNRDFIFKAEENKTKRPPVAKEYISDYEDVWIDSYDGLKLHGYISKGKADTFVIAMHGYTLEGRNMMTKCLGWEQRGYCMLYPDMRGQGKSEGTYIGMGWHDRLDIVSWIEYINQRHSPDNIILYGISMGGAAVMMVAGETLPSNVRCIVEDCGYVSVKEEFRHEGKAVFGVPYYPIVWIGSMITKLRAGWSFEEASALEGLKNTRIPMMFIHGDQDKFVPVSHAYKAYLAAGCEKELFIVPGATHAEAQDACGYEYWEKVLSFTDRYTDGGNDDKSNII